MMMIKMMLKTHKLCGYIGTAALLWLHCCGSIAMAVADSLCLHCCGCVAVAPWSTSDIMPRQCPFAL